MATLADIRLRAQQRSNMENSTFVSTAEWLTYINGSYNELYDLLVSRFEDYFSTSVDFTLSNSSNEYTLTSDFYKIRGLDYQNSSGQFVPIKKFNFDERGQSSFDPNTTTGNYRLWKIPRFTPLANDNDVLGDILDFDEYIVVDAAKKALQKEESDVSVLMADKESLRQRILAMASNRDTNPDRIADVTGRGSRSLCIPERRYRVMGGKIMVVSLNVEPFIY
jgi:hypothetical protein